jgi:hypothetical protein
MSSASVAVKVTVITGATVLLYVHVCFADATEPVLSDPVHVELVKVASSAAARATGTNAEPKSPASKLAVATAVANLFLMI